MPQPTLEHALAAKAVEVDQSRQVVQLVEAVVVEIVEELARAHRVGGHLEIVDARVPVGGRRRRQMQGRAAGSRSGASRYRKIHGTCDAIRVGCTTSEFDLAHRRRRHLRCHSWRGMRRSAASRWRSSTRATSAAARRSTTPRRCTAGCARCSAATRRDARVPARASRALHILPHLVAPAALPLPTYRKSPAIRAVARLVLTDQRPARARPQRGWPIPSKHLPASRVVSREECLQLVPGIDPKGVTGGAIWHDDQLQSTARMTFSFIQSAADGGAAVANYARAVGLSCARATR